LHCRCGARVFSPITPLALKMQKTPEGGLP
jgi:hypothetical protein